MRTDKIEDKNEEKRTLIVGIRKIEKISYTKPFDYYYKRSLTKHEQNTEGMPNLTSNEIFLMQKGILNKELSLERKKVREFKKKFSVKVGHEAYEKNLEDTAEMQEKKYREENNRNVGIDKGR